MRFPPVKSFLPSVKNSLLALLSAILLILSFPDFDFWFIAWVAFVPFFYAIEREKESAIKSLYLGWIFGTAFFFGSCWWLTFSMTTYGGIPIVIAYFLLLCASLIVGFSPAIFAWSFSKVLKNFGTRAILSAPFLWIATEFLRYWLTGNNWNAVGYSQAFSGFTLQSASVGGVHLVGFFILFINSLYVFLTLSIQKSSNSKELRKRILVLFYFVPFLGKWFIEDNEKIYKIAERWKPSDKVTGWCVLVNISLLSAIILFGIILIFTGNNIDYESKSFDENSKTVVIALQPNVPMSNLDYEKWQILRQRHVELAENALQKLGKQRTTNNQQPTIVIFPESPMNFMYADDPEFRQFLKNFAIKHNVSVLFNSAEPVLGTRQYYNSAVMVNSKGEKIAQYDKMHLVPFGEYVPLEEVLGQILPPLVGNFAFGEKYELMPFGDAKGGIVICFESAFASLSRQFALNGADVLVEITNDGYLGETPVLRQHLANAVFRAVETNRPLLRVTNVGITAYINERGEVSGEAKPYTEDTRVWTISKSDGKQTFYVKYGDWFAWLCSILSLGLLILSFRKKVSND